MNRRWLFRILLVFALCLFLAAGMLHEYQKPEPILYDSPTLEMQVSILRSLGLTIPNDLMEEAVRAGSPEEETLREVIKDYPYTWLLTSLGMPEYNENFEITDYSEELFWIDSDVLNINNTLLKDTDSTERFYAMEDDGQGVIIFFYSKEWAEDFEKMTNIKLEKL